MTKVEIKKLAKRSAIVVVAATLIVEIGLLYLFALLFSMGWTDFFIPLGALYFIIRVGISATRFLRIIGISDKEIEEEEKPKLYYKIIEFGDKWFFEVYAMNHEKICRSDYFTTERTCVDGCWYLMDSMQGMNETNFECRSN